MTIMKFLKPGIALATAVLLSNCSSTSSSSSYTSPKKMVVSVADQRLVVFDRNGTPRKSYPVSTSKFGLGDKPGSKKTPIGTMVVRDKVGGGARPGTVFKGRKPTGEVIKPNSPGRDPIVSRILWLGGASGSTKNAYKRYIYIHGTAEEWRVGQPASYGCIRMRSKDVIDLYNTVGVGSKVHVKPGRLYSGEVPRQDQMLVNNLRRRSAFGSGGGEVLAAAEASNHPPMRRSVPVKKTLAKPSKPRASTAAKDPSKRRGMFDR
ncbi:MAG: lipoprotein-anchoring transpeptidase ErfK/SrfK [Verrucomicrobiales bacterium]|jgi:lipoprotein-anchoring transpeptidase ErfK/SrfK